MKYVRYIVWSAIAFIIFIILLTAVNFLGLWYGLSKMVPTPDELRSEIVTADECVIHDIGDGGHVIEKTARDKGLLKSFAAAIKYVGIPHDAFAPARGRHLELEFVRSGNVILELEIEPRGDDDSCILYMRGKGSGDLVARKCDKHLFEVVEEMLKHSE